MTRVKVKVSDIIGNILLFKYDDVIDKTKCSVTAKNIYNHIMDIYSDHKEHISWNDTLSDNYMDLEEFIKTDKKNCVFYVYYEHVTGETSHYFIMVYDNKKNFHVLQSAVFEYSIMDWLCPDNMTYKHTNVDNEEIKKYVDEQNTKNKILRDYTVERIKTSKNLRTDQFVSNMKLLEGLWKDNCHKKCKLFTENFACNMDPDRLFKVFNMNDNHAKFKFRQFKMNILID